MEILNILLIFDLIPDITPWYMYINPGNARVKDEYNIFSIKVRQLL